MGAPRRTARDHGRGGIALGLRFVLLALVSGALMLLDHRDRYVGALHETLSLAVYPIQLVVSAPFSAWRWANMSLAERHDLLEENARLKREQLHASARLQRLAALETENARLRELLESTARLADRVLVAEILSVDLDPYRQRFNLNRGSSDGAYVGQALLDANGIVGQLVNVGPLTSEAVLITDADHAVPVSVNRNGLRTIAVGTGDSGRLRLPYLTQSADIEIGDLLLSSGLGGIFPPGYPVGRVVELRERPGQSFVDAIVEPAAALDRDRQVLLVWTPGDDQPSFTATPRGDEPSDAGPPVGSADGGIVPAGAEAVGAEAAGAEAVGAEEVGGAASGGAPSVAEAR